MTRRTFLLTCLLAGNWLGQGCALEKKEHASVAGSAQARVLGPPTSAGALSREHDPTVPLYESDSLALRELLNEPTEHRETRVKASQLIPVKLLGINDFHGSLSSGDQLGGRPLGGAAVLASYLRAHSRGFEGRVIIAHAGDFVGASPAPSALLGDQPSIDFFNQLSNGHCRSGAKNVDCNLLGTLGNHEFDRGTTELLRLVHGGQKAWNAEHRRYPGQAYPTICANVLNTVTGTPIFPAYLIKSVGATRIGFVGAVLSGAPWFLRKSGIAGLTFADEVETINRAVTALRQQGVRSIVLLIHQGAKQRFSRRLPRDASAVQGEAEDIIARLDAIDVVVSGHSHSALSALVPNREGRPTLLTQAFHSGTAFSDIELGIDPDTGEIVRKRAVIVSTFADAGPGLVPDPDVEKLVRRAEQLAERKTSAVLSRTFVALTSELDQHGESAMGDLVADAQRAALRADMAFTTPSWIRAGLSRGEITWGHLFTAQPFHNRLVRVEMLGRHVVELLNEQWYVETYPRMLQVSGITFRWDARKPRNSRVVEVLVGDKPIELDRKYVAAVNEFLAEGGEGYSTLSRLRRTVTATTDISALAAYVKARPILGPPPMSRAKRVDLD